MYSKAETKTPREKRGNIKRLQALELDGDNLDQNLVWLYYRYLARKGKAAEWMRLALIAAVPSDFKAEQEQTGE